MPDFIFRRRFQRTCRHWIPSQCYESRTFRVRSVTDCTAILCFALQYSNSKYVYVTMFTTWRGKIIMRITDEYCYLPISRVAAGFWLTDKKTAVKSLRWNAQGYRELQITANKMQRFLNLYIFTGALQVSGGSSAHHQEQKLYIQLQSIVNQYCC